MIKSLPHTPGWHQLITAVLCYGKGRPGPLALAVAGLRTCQSPGLRSDADDVDEGCGVGDVQKKIDERIPHDLDEYCTSTPHAQHEGAQHRHTARAHAAGTHNASTGSTTRVCIAPVHGADGHRMGASRVAHDVGKRGVQCLPTVACRRQTARAHRAHSTAHGRAQRGHPERWPELRAQRGHARGTQGTRARIWCMFVMSCSACVHVRGPRNAAAVGAHCAGCTSP